MAVIAGAGACQKWNKRGVHTFLIRKQSGTLHATTSTFTQMAVFDTTIKRYQQGFALN